MATTHLSNGRYSLTIPASPPTWPTPVSMEIVVANGKIRTVLYTFTAVSIPGVGDAYRREGTPQYPIFIFYTDGSFTVITADGSATGTYTAIP